MKFDSTGKRMQMMFAKGKWSKIKKATGRWEMKWEHVVSFVQDAMGDAPRRRATGAGWEA